MFKWREISYELANQHSIFALSLSCFVFNMQFFNQSDAV